MLSSLASWEGDGSDSLEAAGQITPWRGLVKTGTGEVEVSWGVLVFPRFNWELNVTLKLQLPQRRDGANLLSQRVMFQRLFLQD